LFLSHLHLDHIIGLHSLVKQKFPKGLFVVVLQENTAALRTFVAQPYTIAFERLPFSVELIEAPQALKKVPFPVTVLPVMHPDPTMGVRIVLDGKTVVFSGDTGACDNLYTLAKDADVLITECAFRPGETSTAWPHLNPESAAQLAVEAKVGRLFLTHFDASRYLTLADRVQAEQAAKKIFKNTVAATDGLILTLL
jgi:ribonuclease BN (tRNA processing enzyme)